jgi:hypothetical protein
MIMRNDGNAQNHISATLWKIMFMPYVT